MKILVVEDDVEFAETLADFLRTCGHEVEVASNVPVASAKLDHLRPDVMLVDVKLPVFDGTLLAREVRERGYATRIIGMTGDQRFFGSTHFDRLLRKPFLPERLLTELGGRAPSKGA